MENYNNPQPTQGDNGQMVAIVSYITVFGWVLALILHSNRKTSLGAFHLRQMLGLMIVAFAIFLLRYPLYLTPFFGAIIINVLNIGMFIFWIMGLISAINAREKPVPVFGDLFQKWFAGLGV